ncbi:hypothetical protein C8J56DRAFT_788879, partial [Mycena floridula]
WALDLEGVMTRLPIPVLWDLSRNKHISTVHCEALVVQVRHSMEVYLQHEIDHSSCVRDLLFGRREWDKDSKTLVVKVLAFRHYLRVKKPKHRRVLVHVMLSGHGLAMERMRQGKCYKPIVPREWRLCRFCVQGQKDMIHTLLLCSEPQVMEHRKRFMEDLNLCLPGFCQQFLDPGLFLRALVAERETVDIVAKFCYDVLQRFYSVPMLYVRGNES